MAVGRPNEYISHVAPRLLEVEAWARNGDIDKTIAKKLGVAYSTLRDYKKQYSALSAALKKGKEVVDIEVENALLKKAKGYNAHVKKTFKVKEVYYDEQGRRCEKEHLQTAVDEVHVPADTTAQIFWLKNRKPQEWRDKQETELSGGLDVRSDKLNAILEQLNE